MQNTNPLDFVKYFSLKATADQVHMVGIEGVKVNADNLLVEINQSTPTVYGLPLFPVVDFANTPQFKVNERQTLFNIFDTNGDKEISDSELAAALNYDPQLANPITTTDQLVQLLDVGGAPPGSGPDGILSVDEVLGQLNPNLDSATIQSIKNADADGDGKFDPPGYEVATGGAPVYLNMDSPVIRAQGYMNIQIFDNFFLSGSVAFELGPTQKVHLVGDLPDTPPKEVTTMTIGASDVTAFIGVNGPYWTDSNGDHQVQQSELNPNSKGFYINDLDVGIMLMASTNPSDLGV